MRNQRTIWNSYESRATTHEPRATSHVSRRLRRQGFTLVELVLVIILVAILASIAVPRFVNLSRQADIAATRGAMGAIRGAVVMDYASRTLVNRGVAKFSNVVYHSWFMELDIPINEIANTSRVMIAAVPGAAPGPGTAVTGESGQIMGLNISNTHPPTAANLVARDLNTNTTGTAGDGALCCATGFACVDDTTPSIGWVYESTGDFEGIIKPCGDNSDDAGFTDDTADVW